MKKIKRNKPWRLNIVIKYYKPEQANNYRTDILMLLKNLASIYKLDYAISENHQFPNLSDSSDQSEYKGITDLFYFRSNKNSRVDQKKLKSVIACMFDKVPSVVYEGVEVFHQLYKALSEYPFPKYFYRPLIYPYLQYHKDSQKTLYTYADGVMKVIEDEQDYPLN